MLKVTDFFSNSYVNYASYDNIRKIASLVDGQKNAARKVLHTVLSHNIRSKVKVSILNSRMSEFTEYLHGAADNVIVNLGQSYTGTNNLPLLQAAGNFGTRFVPDASASRYIFTYGTKEFFDLFKKVDNNILQKQQFEGTEIEPKFFVPSLPLLLINGAEGLSPGFAQKILPRNQDTLKRYIKTTLAGKIPKVKLTPFYKGFNGVIEQGINPAQWIIKGCYEQLRVNVIRITELPIGYNLKSYLKVLDTLEDKKVIQGYRDKSEDDKFLFEVTIPSKSLKAWTPDEVLSKMKLVKTVTENYTAMDENNKITVCESAKELLDKYIAVKLQYMQKRKDYLIPKMEDDIRLDYSKYVFIESIVNNNLVINKRKKVDIVADLDKYDNIIKRDGSYDYLLNMAIHSLTTERMTKLSDDIKAMKMELETLKNTTIEEMWSVEL